MPHTRIPDEIDKTIKNIKCRPKYNEDDKLIEKIIQATADKTLKLEKIKKNGHDLWSLKLGNSERAMATIDDGTLYIHDLLPQHNYKDSTLLKDPGKVLSNIANYRAIDNTTHDKQSDQSGYTRLPEQYIRITDSRIIKLDASQKDLVEEATDLMSQNVDGPGIVYLVEGQAGSGKTIAMLEILATMSGNDDDTYTSTHEDADADPKKRKVIVLVKQEKLRDEIEKNYQDDYANDKIDVEFITYEDILEQNHLKEKVADFSHFQAWYQDFRKKEIQKTKNAKPSPKQKHSKSKKSNKDTEGSSNPVDWSCKEWTKDALIYQDLQQIAAQQNLSISTGKKKLISGVVQQELEKLYNEYKIRTNKDLLDPTLDIAEFIKDITPLDDIDALCMDECYDWVAGEYALINKLLPKKYNKQKE